MPHRVFALIVAIDDYKSPALLKLKKCDEDAKVFRGFLLETFGPHNLLDNIKVLKNEQATRAAIISTFRTHLIENKKIRDQDPIIFYFAGHGSRIKGPAGWETNSKDDKIEAICPYDENTVDETGETVRCIPDLTLFKLLQQLIREGRNNVTVILDSCHSGGGTRDSIEPGYSTVRCRGPLPQDVVPFPPVDYDIWTLPSSHQEIGHDDPDILLAACTSAEEARDGYFTAALVKCLRTRAGIYTTVSDLKTLLPSRLDQHPVCRGDGDRILFSTSVVDKERRSYALKPVGARFEVNAGAIHGIADGALFRLPGGKGCLQVEHANVYTSVLVRTPETATVDIPAGTKAVAIPTLRSAILKVYLEPTLADFAPATHSESWFEIIRDKEAAHAVLFLERGRYGRQMLHVRLQEPLFTAVPFTPTPFVWDVVKTRLDNFLDVIALFRYHLGRHRRSNTLFTSYPDLNHERDLLSSHADVALFQLAPQQNSDLFRHPADLNKNLLAEKTKGVVVLRSSEEERYGIRLVNKAKEDDLYFYLFYLNPTDFSILAWTSADSAKLAPGETITVGYGAAGRDPILFQLEPGQRTDSGFLKLFVANRAVDRMDTIQQFTAAQPQQLRRVRPVDIFSRADWGAWIGIVTVTIDEAYLNK